MCCYARIKQHWVSCKAKNIVVVVHSQYLIMSCSLENHSSTLFGGFATN
jgi:hypothetical protein